MGALEGLKAALRLPQVSISDIVVCLDNLAADTCLQGTVSGSSQVVFLEFQALALTHGATQVRWIPGHTSIPGNEQADVLAKAGSSLPSPPDATPTLAFLRRVARQRPRQAFELWWSETAPEKYRPMNLKATTKCPPELKLPRAALHHLLAARSHHGDFAEYHERLNHANARLTFSCGRRKSPAHIFYCRKILPHHRMRLMPSPEVAIPRLIGREYTKFIQIGAESNFFGNIWPRHQRVP